MMHRQDKIKDLESHLVSLWVLSTIVLIVISLHFVQKHFRHQDTKAQRLIFKYSFALCLCALVAIFPVYPG